MFRNPGASLHFKMNTAPSSWRSSLSPFPLGLGIGPRWAMALLPLAARDLMTLKSASGKSCFKATARWQQRRGIEPVWLPSQMNAVTSRDSRDSGVVSVTKRNGLVTSHKKVTRRYFQNRPLTNQNPIHSQPASFGEGRNFI